MPADKQTPTDAEWDQAGKRADVAVRDALAALVREYNQAGANPLLFAPMCFGAITACGELFRIVLKDDGLPMAEEWACSYLRGALRGLDKPVHEDGREFVGQLDG